MFLLYLFILFTSTISIYIINSPSLLKTHDAAVSPFHSSLIVIKCFYGMLIVSCLMPGIAAAWAL